MDDPSVSSVAVLSMFCSAITSSLHKHGVLPIQAVIEELQEIGTTNVTQCTTSAQANEFLVAMLRQMTVFAEQLGPFEPR